MLGASSILNACYFLPIVYRAFFKEAESGIRNPESNPLPSHTLTKGELGGINEAPALMVAALVLTASGTVALFFKPALFLELAKIVVAGVTGGN